ncbi:MAG: multidrug resistance efflux transporter family protein, partial [Clostridium sp.]|nr:multidrug resistance efflux transporter family protein [Clostridium sp.]
MEKAIFYGIISSMFFAFTFIFNRSMNLGGGSWVWSGVLRYFFMMPMLYLIVLREKGIRELFESIKSNLLYWLVWSTVGFGLFYAPLTFASDYGQSWLVAGCWQITIVCGILLTPVFNKKIPLKSLSMSCVILCGVFFIQYEHATSVELKEIFLCVIPIVIAAFSYPFGNRKMMEVCKGRLTTTQRVLGMTICSMPFWIMLGIYGYITDG